MGNLARYNSSVSVIDAEIVAESYLQQVPAEYHQQLRQPIIYLSQQGEDGSIQQLINAAINRQESRLYQCVRELQPEMEALRCRQDALENRMERLERQPACLPAAEFEPPTNFQLLSIITLLVILAAMLIGGSIERDSQPHRYLEGVRVEKGVYRD